MFVLYKMNYCKPVSSQKALASIISKKDPSRVVSHTRAHTALDHKGACLIFCPVEMPLYSTYNIPSQRRPAQHCLVYIHHHDCVVSSVICRTVFTLSSWHTVIALCMEMFVILAEKSVLS